MSKIKPRYRYNWKTKEWNRAPRPRTDYAWLTPAPTLLDIFVGVSDRDRMERQRAFNRKLTEIECGAFANCRVTDYVHKEINNEQL